MSGKLFVITAPSGAGKTSLINALLKDDPRLRLSISYTTRAPRPGEANTLASKAAGQQISDGALELKLLVEQIREQVQNIE